MLYVCSYARELHVLPLCSRINTEMAGMKQVAHAHWSIVSCAAWTTFSLQTIVCFFLVVCPPGRAELIQIDATAALQSNSSLEYHLCEAGEELQSGTTLQLSLGTHTLGEGPFCLLQNLENITIQGGRQDSTDSTTVIQCSDDSNIRRGIAFFNITNLRIEGVRITNCGREVPSGLPGYVNETYTFMGPQQRAVLIFTHCTDMSLENVAIDMCYGFGLVAINPLGEATIERVSITNTDSRNMADCSNPRLRSDSYCAGSGAVFVYADTNITQSLVDTEQNSTTLRLIECTFNNNINLLSDQFFFSIFRSLVTSFDTVPILMTGASGLAVYLGQLQYFVDVSIINSTLKQNSGTFGGMLLLHYNTIRNSKTCLDGMMVADNNAVVLERGGGLFIQVSLFLNSLNSLPHYPNDIYDLVEISRSTFHHNSALHGGAIQLYATSQNVSDFRVIIRESNFIHNVGQFGAVFNSFQFRSTIKTSAMYVLIEDVIASQNTHPEADLSNTSPENSAVFLIIQNDNITIVGNEGKGCFFRNNSIGVFLSSGTNVILRGVISFEGNQGFTGGALSLLDNSILFIHNGSVLNFTRNCAVTRGGAIYADTLGSAVTETCVIQFVGETHFTIDVRENLKLLNVSITFSQNEAGLAGNSFYGNPLYSCIFLPQTAIDNTAAVYGITNDNVLLYQEAFQFPLTVTNELAEINSAPVEICVCQNSSFIRDNCDNSVFYPLDYPIVPGQTFNLFLNPVDLIGTPVNSILYSVPINKLVGYNTAVQLGANQYTRELPGTSSCSSVDFTMYASENSEVHLKLFASAGGLRATVVVNVTSCPPGFTLVTIDSLQQCACSSFVENNLGSSCNLSLYTIARPRNYWVGTQSNNGTTTLEYVSTCPINYCRNDISDIDLTISDQLCVSGRTGRLCGSCEDGLSSVFGSAECRKCSNAWLTTIVVYIVMGIALVFVFFLLDTTITFGSVNGIIFYANIVSVNANIYFRGAGQGFLFWFVSWVNLELGFPLCFFDGMNEAEKIGLQYAFPTYLLLMIGGIILLSQRSKLMQRIVARHSGIHVLATMFYLTYSKILRTVIDGTTLVTLVIEDSGKSETVWFFDGNRNRNSPETTFFIVFGSLTIVFFILPYVFVMTFSKYVQRVVRSPRLDAHIDASHAPFKEELRFWFGARLILILILYIILAGKGTNNPSLTLTIQLSLLVGFGILQGFIRPFKKTVIELLDMSFIVNIIFLTLGTTYTIQEASLIDEQRVLVDFSLSIAFITFIGILTYHSVSALNTIPAFKKRANLLVVRMKNIYEVTTRRLKGQRDSELPADEPQAETTVLSNTTKFSTVQLSLQDMVPAPDDAEKPPVEISFSQLREPVLDFAPDWHTR